MQEFFRRLEEKIITRADLIFYLEKIDLALSLLQKDTANASLEQFKGRADKLLVDIITELAKEKKEFQKAKQQIFFLEMLKEHLFSLPKVKMQLAFSPDADSLARISQWLEKEFKYRVILDITVNPGLMAGAIIEYQGKRANFSLSKKMKEIKIASYLNK